MKRCPKCKKNLSNENYYKYKNRYDGLDWCCKDCQRLRYREKRERNIDSFKEKEKRYYNKNREKVIAKRKLDYQVNRKKILAREQVKTALSRGLLIRLPCEVCKVVSTQAHHPDYDKPLEIRWLCTKHHARLHAGDDI